MFEICTYDECTGCCACMNICPTKSIIMKEDANGYMCPTVDEEKCIHCNLCRNTCPINNMCKCLQPRQAYAAWNLNIEERRTSASGGIAVALYSYAIENGWNCVGTVMDKDFNVVYEISKNKSQLDKFKNSKYAYSFTNDIYRKINDLLNKGEKVIFVGLPCQVAGLKNYLKEEKESLLTIDLVCHGVPPIIYLKEHILNIQRKRKKSIDKVSFRSESTFDFTLFSDNKKIYRKKVKSNDGYQLGYHKALFYRENCYKCKYARKERTGDITLGDYSGLGAANDFKYEKRKISLVLIQTEKGQKVINRISKNGKIFLVERPIEESINAERQLREPSKKHPKRNKFLELIKEHTFEYSIKKTLRTEMIKNRIIEILKIKECKDYICKKMNRKLKSKIKLAIFHIKH